MLTYCGLSSSAVAGGYVLVRLPSSLCTGLEHDREYCKVWTGFAFLGFLKNVLGLLTADSACPFVCWWPGLLFWCSNTHELWSIVWGYNIWSAVSYKVTLQLSYCLWACQFPKNWKNSSQWWGSLSHQYCRCLLQSFPMACLGLHGSISISFGCFAE